MHRVCEEAEVFCMDCNYGVPHLDAGKEDTLCGFKFKTVKLVPVVFEAVMSSKYSKQYDHNRDRFYGVEYDPYTGKSYDCRDRD